MKTLEDYKRENQELKKRILEVEEQIPIPAKRGDIIRCSSCGCSIEMIMDMNDVRNVICDQCAH